MSNQEEMNGVMAPMHFRVNTEGISAEAQQAVVDSIRVVPNFPKPGLFFKDLSLLLGNPAAFGSTIDAIVHKYARRGITGALLLLPSSSFPLLISLIGIVAAVVGIECRGFCFAAPVAIALKVPFVPFRKPGKLPCESAPPVARGSRGAGKSIGIDFKQSAGKHSAYFGKDRSSLPPVCDTVLNLNRLGWRCMKMD